MSLADKYKVIKLIPAEKIRNYLDYAKKENQIKRFTSSSLL